MHTHPVYDGPDIQPLLRIKSINYILNVTRGPHRTDRHLIHLQNCKEVAKLCLNQQSNKVGSICLEALAAYAKRCHIRTLDCRICKPRERDNIFLKALRELKAMGCVAFVAMPPESPGTHGVIITRKGRGYYGSGYDKLAALQDAIAKLRGDSITERARLAHGPLSLALLPHG